MGKFRKYIRSFDAFGPGIAVNFKGKSSYNTIFGALCTIMTNLFVIIFAAG